MSLGISFNVDRLRDTHSSLKTMTKKTILLKKKTHYIHIETRINIFVLTTMCFVQSFFGAESKKLQIQTFTVTKQLYYKIRLFKNLFTLQIGNTASNVKRQHFILQQHEACG